MLPPRVTVHSQPKEKIMKFPSGVSAQSALTDEGHWIIISSYPFGLYRMFRYSYPDCDNNSNDSKNER